MAFSNKMTLNTKVQPLDKLHPSLAIWKIKVVLTSKGSMRTYHNAKGPGCFFKVELTDEDGTQMQATMFNEAARKFIDKFEIGKVYYISKGIIKPANKQFTTIDNDYELTLTQYSQVDEVMNESMVVPEKTFNLVPLDQLGPYVNKKTLVDIIGVVQHVSPTVSIRRKIDQQIVPKRDITLVDQTKTSVVVCLWNDLATSVGQQLFDMEDTSPIVAIKSVKVGEFKGISLSTVSNSYIRIYPDIPQCLYESKGKEMISDLLCSASTRSMKTPSPSMFSDRVTLDFITNNPFLGEDKPVYFSTRASMTYINPHQNMSYSACNTCKKKVLESGAKGYWCDRCKRHQESFTLRYILSAKFSDATGEAWFSVFDADAETLLGCSANELSKMKSEEEGIKFHLQLRKAKWVPFHFRVSVARTEYNNVRRQKINVISIAPMDYAAEAQLLLNEISAMQIQRCSKSPAKHEQNSQPAERSTSPRTHQPSSLPSSKERKDSPSVDDRRLQQKVTPSPRRDVGTTNATTRSPVEEDVGRGGNDSPNNMSLVEEINETTAMKNQRHSRSPAKHEHISEVAKRSTSLSRDWASSPPSCKERKHSPSIDDRRLQEKGTPSPTHDARISKATPTTPMEGDVGRGGNDSPDIMSLAEENKRTQSPIKIAIKNETPIEDEE
ncbi:hypothetical protein OSB04_007937, partial [Centaurea solstitialis]